MDRLPRMRRRGMHRPEGPQASQAGRPARRRLAPPKSTPVLGQWPRFPAQTPPVRICATCCHIAYPPSSRRAVRRRRGPRRCRCSQPHGRPRPRPTEEPTLAAAGRDCRYPPRDRLHDDREHHAVSEIDALLRLNPLLTSRPPPALEKETLGGRSPLELLSSSAAVRRKGRARSHARVSPYPVAGSTRTCKGARAPGQRFRRS